MLWAHLFSQQKYWQACAPCLFFVVYFVKSTIVDNLESVYSRIGSTVNSQLREYSPGHSPHHLLCSIVKCETNFDRADVLPLLYYVERKEKENIVLHTFACSILYYVHLHVCAATRTRAITIARVITRGRDRALATCIRVLPAATADLQLHRHLLSSASPLHYAPFTSQPSRQPKSWESSPSVSPSLTRRPASFENPRTRFRSADKWRKLSGTQLPATRQGRALARNCIYAYICRRRHLNERLNLPNFFFF